MLAGEGRPAAPGW